MIDAVKVTDTLAVKVTIKKAPVGFFFEYLGDSVTAVDLQSGFHLIREVLKEKFNQNIVLFLEAN